MPEEIGLEISNIFNAMGTAILQTISFYFFIPLLGIAVIGAYIFKLRGRKLSFIISLTAIICLLVFANLGLEDLIETFNSKMSE